MDPPLQRLDPPHRPVRNHRSTANLVIRLQPFNLPKKKINLVRPASPRIPTRLLHRGTRNTKRKRRRKIPNIKLHRLPVDDLVTQLVRDILGFLPLMELQPSSPNYIYFRVIGMRLQMEEVLEKIKVGLNPQESITQMNKDRDVNNRIRGQVMHLNPPMVKKASEEIRNGKIEAPKNMRKKNDRLVSPLMRKRLPIGTPPIDQVLGLKKMLLRKIQKMGVGTLTRLPPVDLRLANGSVVHLPLRSRSLWHH